MGLIRLIGTYEEKSFFILESIIKLHKRGNFGVYF